MPAHNRLLIDAGGLALALDTGANAHMRNIGYGLVCDAPGRRVQCRRAGRGAEQFPFLQFQAAVLQGRTLEAIALPLRRHLRRLGVPFSGEGTTVPGAGETRRLQRLVEVLGKTPHRYIVSKGPQHAEYSSYDSVRRHRLACQQRCQ